MSASAVIVQPMVIHPFWYDLLVARQLARFAAAHEQFTLGVASGIRHTVLGGLWFGAAIYLVWSRAAGTSQRDTRLRVFTIVVASVIAILLSFVAGLMISWPPPIRLSDLENLYPPAMGTNPNTNCFPSLSTAAYATIAAGIYSLRRTWGCVLWILVAFFIALPRMYVGGHYLTDVLVGAALALSSYAAARYVLEATVISRIEPFLHQRPISWFLVEFLMYIWIVQVTMEFREVTWAQAVVRFFLK